MGAVDKVEGMCFDTTASNTGKMKGACILLEHYLGKDLLYLACRHHILEIILKSVFDCKMGATTGPQPEIFKKFQAQWSKIDKTKYNVGLDDETVQNTLKDYDVEEISSFLLNQLLIHQPRDDYKEFLVLSLVFLGKLSPEEFSFRLPGPIHHARWMAKALYCLKMFLFRNQFSMSSSELHSLRDICLFLVLIYVKPWFNATNSSMAPNQDLTLVKNLVEYKKIDSDLANAALSKLLNHLWYLNSEQVVFGLFDPTLPPQVKVNMASKLLALDDEEDSEEDREVKAQVRLDEADSLLDKELDYFVNQKTQNFFKRFNINPEFLVSEQETWKNNADYLRALKIVENLRVVNDTAERGVKLIQDFNILLTKNEEQKQFVLQAVDECRRLYPDVKKSTLSKDLPST